MDRVEITIHIDHPAVFLASGVYSFQGECPVAPTDSIHQTHITAGHSECPGCGAEFDTYLLKHAGIAQALVVRW